jgi:hypothetical protein
LFDGLAKGGDDAVDFRNKGFGKERDSHGASWGLFSQDCNRDYHGHYTAGEWRR